MFLTTRLALAATLLCLALPATAAGTLDKIKSSGEIHLGVRSDAAPLSFTGPDGKPAGYTVDVCAGVTEALAKSLGLDKLTPVFVPVTAADRFAAITEGRADLLCGADTITLERRATVDFSIPTFVDGAAVLLRTGTNPELSALAGKKIGVMAGTTTEQALTNTLKATGIKADVIAVASHQAGFDALKSGQIDAYFGDQSILFTMMLAADSAKTLSISDNTLTVEKQGLVLPRGDADFRLAVDAAISEMYRSGRMAEIFKTNLPGANPGLALQALFVIAPDLP